MMDFYVVHGRRNNINHHWEASKYSEVACTDSLRGRGKILMNEWKLVNVDLWLRFTQAQ